MCCSPMKITEESESVLVEDIVLVENFRYFWLFINCKREGVQVSLAEKVT